MTKDEALRLALDWLESGNFVYPTKIRTAIKEALEQPVQQVQQVQKDELAGVAYVDDLDLWHFYPLRETVNFPAGTKFYTTPQQRQWVGLTDEEIDKWTPEIHGVIRIVEQLLKEKNL